MFYITPVGLLLAELGPFHTGFCRREKDLKFKLFLIISGHKEIGSHDN